MPKAASSGGKGIDVAIAAALPLLGMAALLAPELLLSVAPPCLATALLGLECWGCGMARATVALVHADFHAAWALNRLAFVVAPSLGLLYLGFLLKIVATYRRADGGSEALQ